MTPAAAHTWLHDDVARPLSPPLTMTPLHRSAEKYAAVLDQFDVENAARYRPRQLPGMSKVGTWCNVFASDVLDAVWAPIPHRAADDTFRDVRAMAEMLRAGYDGWRAVTADEAKAAASKGLPTVVVFDPTDRGHGHIAIVRPPLKPSAAIFIAQAGARCHRCCPLVIGFGALGPLLFFTHD